MTRSGRCTARAGPSRRLPRRSASAGTPSSAISGSDLARAASTAGAMGAACSIPTKPPAGAVECRLPDGDAALSGAQPRATRGAIAVSRPMPAACARRKALATATPGPRASRCPSWLSLRPNRLRHAGRPGWCCGREATAHGGRGPAARPAARAGCPQWPRPSTSRRTLPPWSASASRRSSMPGCKRATTSPLEALRRFAQRAVGRLCRGQSGGDAALEQRAGRGPHQSLENAEAPDVWPGTPRSPQPPLRARPTTRARTCAPRGGHGGGAGSTSGGAPASPKVGKNRNVCVNPCGRSTWSHRAPLFGFKRVSRACIYNVRGPAQAPSVQVEAESYLFFLLRVAGRWGDLILMHQKRGRASISWSCSMSATTSCYRAPTCASRCWLPR